MKTQLIISVALENSRGESKTFLNPDLILITSGFLGTDTYGRNIVLGGTSTALLRDLATWQMTNDTTDIVVGGRQGIVKQ